MIRVTVGEFEVCVQPGDPPLMLDEYCRRASRSEHFESAADAGGGWLFVAVGSPGEFPRLVITQRYAPAWSGFIPGVLVVP